MIDINFIMNGKKKKKSKDPLKDLMLKPKGSIINDRITKQQKKVFKKAKKQRSFIPLFSDWDGDGVINGLDCMPKNKRKHAYWKRMDPQLQRQMRDDIIEQHYQKEGYYKYGGPDRLQQEDLDNAKNMFSQNPIKRYITINRDRITPDQRKVLNSGQDRFTDTDGDGVVDGLDCKPNNPNKHNEDDDDLMKVAMQTLNRPEEVERDWRAGAESQKQQRDKYYESIKGSTVNLTDEQRERLSRANYSFGRDKRIHMARVQLMDDEEFEYRQKLAQERHGKDWIDLDAIEKRQIRKERIGPGGYYREIPTENGTKTTYRGWVMDDD